MSSDIILPYVGSQSINIKFKEFNHHHLKQHWHQFFEFEFLISGSGTHKINENSYPIKKGEMHLTKLTDIHEFFFDSDCRLYMVQFPVVYFSEEINSLILNCDKDMVVYFNETEFEKMKCLFELLLEENQKDDFCHSEIIKCMIKTLLLFFFRKLGVNETVSLNKKNDRMSNIILYLQNNFHHSLNLKEIANEFYMNSEYFTRYFKKHMGIGPKEYLVGIRMEYAKKLVCETKMKILDICMACGYNSVTTFLRNFKQKYQCTPKQMRARNERI